MAMELAKMLHLMLSEVDDQETAAGLYESRRLPDSGGGVREVVQDLVNYHEIS